MEVAVSAAYGTSRVGGAPLSEWLQAGNITTTLFAGLFRPVASLRQQIEEVSTQLYPSNGQVCIITSFEGGRGTCCTKHFDTFAGVTSRCTAKPPYTVITGVTLESLSAKNGVCSYVLIAYQASLTRCKLKAVGRE